MLKVRRMKAGKRYIEAVLMELGSKNMIVLKGRKGYVMCGYLDLGVAEKFQDAAVRITGVATIGQAVKSQVSSCTKKARQLGIFVGQPVKEVLKIIA
jgi:uncharacterized protein YunC (DUF1805 family)